MRKIGIMCVVTCVLAISTSAFGNLIVNGDFATGNLNGWTTWVQRANAGSTLFTVENGQGKFWGANFNGGIYQTFPTVVGQEYQISGWGKYAVSGTVNQSTWSEVLVGTSAPVAGQDYNNGMTGVQLCAKQTTTSSAMVQFDKVFSQWDSVPPVLTFTAASTSTTIVLKHGNTTGSTKTGMFVDNIVVEAVPEPVSALLLLAGLPMLRRRR